MKTIAVITGDLVRSRKISQEDIPVVLRKLKDIFDELNKHLLDGKAAFDIFRGDGFQLVLGSPEKALLAAILIRAGLRSFKPSSHTDRLVSYTYIDARVAVGVGGVRYLGTWPSDQKIYNAYLQWKQVNASESQGEAFERSGFLLDSMKKRGIRLGIDVTREEVNRELMVESMLADAIINRWTTPTAQAVYRHLLYGENQTMLARAMGVSQPAIYKRLVVSGNIDAIKSFVDRYQEIIMSRKEA